MFNNDEDDFLNEMNDPDPIDEIRLREIWEKSMATSMNYAWETIEEAGMELWLKSVPFNSERKRRILTNMIDWYEKREEFEKCAVLLTGVKQIDAVNK